MNRLLNLVAEAGALGLSALLSLISACSEESSPASEPEVGSDAPVTLADELTAAGLPPGNWRVQSGGNAVCTRTFTYPGAPAPTTESIDLSGFSTFELRIEDEFPALRGAYDQLTAQWIDDCVVFDASVNTVTNHTDCGVADPNDTCTPFNVVRLCAAGGSPTFYAQVPNCGQNTFPAVPQ